MKGEMCYSVTGWPRATRGIDRDKTKDVDTKVQANQIQENKTMRTIEHRKVLQTGS